MILEGGKVLLVVLDWGPRVVLGCSLVRDGLVAKVWIGC